MKYRYGYVKKADSPRLTAKSLALRAIERKQVAVANEGTIECWFTAEELGLVAKTPEKVYPVLRRVPAWSHTVGTMAQLGWVH